MDDTSLAPGDRCHLHYDLNNFTADFRMLDVYILLDIAGEYWSYPSWQPIYAGLDGLFNVPASPQSEAHVNVLDFFWEDYSTQPYSGLYFHGAAFDAGTFQVFGDFQSIEWGFR